MIEFFEVGEKYSRNSISVILENKLNSNNKESMARNMRISREGIVKFEEYKTTFLFVTLDKTDYEKRFQFNEYFEGEVIRWESQPRNTIDSVYVKNIIEKKHDFLLFVRINRKIKSITQPFIYCGKVEYHTHEKDSTKPVKMSLKSLDYQKNTNNILLKNIYEWRPKNLLSNTTNKTYFEEGKLKSNYVPPDSTTRSGLVTSRVGQGWYRNKLIEKWNGKCAITGSERLEILIASHILPWRKANDKERLDVDNGILLSPNIDALFDKHLISFNDNGEILLSKVIHEEEYLKLGIKKTMRIDNEYINDNFRKYLKLHRDEFNEKNNMIN